MRVRLLVVALLVLPACTPWVIAPAPAPDRPSPSVARRPDPAPWMRDLDALAADRDVSIAVVVGGRQVYGHLDHVPRAPASNEKLLLTMALLDRAGPRATIPTIAAAADLNDGTIPGDLWLVGAGDPLLDAGDLRMLADRLRAAGLRKVQGSVLADTSAFRRDRWAFGWRPIALRFVGVPTALAFEGNVDGGGFVLDPERRAANSFATSLQEAGIEVAGGSGTGVLPAGLTTLGAIRSASLAGILREQNVHSDNTIAETLSSALAVRAGAARGSIAAGARVIRRWAAGWGARIRAFDASGLSYRDRVSAATLAQLLDRARRQSWGPAFLGTLARPGEGTLAGRLGGLPLRAKTGTLILEVSALSGFVRMGEGRWAAFSVLCRGMPTSTARGIQDQVVTTLAAAPPPHRSAA